MPATINWKNIVFNKLTPNSIANIKNRINEKKEESIDRKKGLFFKRFERKNDVKSNKKYSTGNKLSEVVMKIIPTELFGVPLEEIDETRRIDYVSSVYFPKMLFYLK
jgi:hypothetical protein